jgi:dTDP-4-dehydrorhamnose 3,5-epimerase
MQITKLEIPDVLLIEPRRLEDARGYFMEVLHEKTFKMNVADVHFVQDNEAMSVAIGTMRGLHFQKPPAAHGKLVRVLNGAVYDVAVDIRHGSPSFGKHVAVELDASAGNMLWIPPGFAHGYCTLKNDSLVAYKITDFYSAEHDTGIVWNDPQIGINWPVNTSDAILSEKDRLLPLLADVPPFFTFQKHFAEKT